MSKQKIQPSSNNSSVQESLAVDLGRSVCDNPTWVFRPHKHAVTLSHFLHGHTCDDREDRIDTALWRVHIEYAYGLLNMAF